MQACIFLAEMGKEIKGKKKRKKEIWGKYNFLQYQIIKLN